jgi:hypothetical protein
MTQEHEKGCDKRTFFQKLFGSKENHFWQTRATNRYGLSTYEVCLKCGKARQRNAMGAVPQFRDCERLKEFDQQFDENGKYIFDR